MRVWMMGSHRQTAWLSGDGCRCVGLRCLWSREPRRTAFRTEASAFTFRQSAGAQVEHRPCVTTRCGLSTLFCCSIGSIDSYRTTPNPGAADPVPRRDRPRLLRPAES